jgi:hypothetical protein
MADYTDALTLIKSQLRDWGLDALSGDIEGYLVGGDSPTVAMAKLRDTQAYKTRFKANELRKQKGLAALSEAEILGNEMQYRQVMRSYGLPEGFYDSYEDFTNFLANDVSPQEMRDRVTLAAERFIFAPQEDKDQFTRFGLTPGQAIATILDPDRAEPLIRQTVTAIGLAAEAARAFGDSERLSTDRAMELSKLGVTQDEARTGFGRLAGSQASDMALSRRQGFGVTETDLEDEAILGRRNTQLDLARAQETADFRGSYVGTSTGFSRGDARNY